MKIHGNAQLTVKQREEIQRLYREGGHSYRSLATRYGVDKGTIQKWVKRSSAEDRASGPRKHGRRQITEAYRAAVIAYREANPHYGPIRIAQALHGEFPFAKAGTVSTVLRAAKLTRPRGPKKSLGPST